ncbi:SOS response-associated peptidase family protein [Psychroserpens sp. Hel_I_66]|uniref:SOS response-associated peptidase family protein n=1 Tax=Psychroserpens sp. Hel_I_66 TaxID=1250004 RepID=UPI000647679A|nr:SOS response-associated peptidase family protein [Psychroserpens sp. Hel_I_66]
MFYKLSNNSSKELIESEIGISFKHPNLYEPKQIINGLDEEVLPIITSQNQNQIQFGIWGILPENYSDDWINYQKLNNTLNVTLDNLNNQVVDYSKSRKCVIIIKGFFSSFIKDGQIYPYYVYHESQKPFLIGGIYNILSDGFITCSPVLTKAGPSFKKIHNISNTMPIIIDKNQIETWLETSLNIKNKKNISLSNDKLYAHSISRQFYETELIFDSILEPQNYNGLENNLVFDNSYIIT